jgi:hypothetical protein
MESSTPMHPKPLGQLPGVQILEQMPPIPAKMQIPEAHSALSEQASPNCFLGTVSGTVRSGTG